MNAISNSLVESSPVFDASAASFEQDVFQRSSEVPVLVDFWATWCAPCKALGPILEKLAEEYQGSFLLAKVDVDREPALAGHFRIRSVPTVMLIHNGEVVGGFPGALPERQVREFLQKHGVVPPAGEGASGETAVMDPEARVAHLRTAMEAAPDQPELRLDLALALVSAGEFAEAKALLDGLPANLGADSRAVRAHTRIRFATAVAEAPPQEALERRVSESPDDLQARYLLGVRLILAGEGQTGIDQFLEMLQRDRSFADGLPRKALVDAFHLVEDDAVVRAGRRRMTALLF